MVDVVQKRGLLEGVKRFGNLPLLQMHLVPIPYSRLGKTHKTKSNKFAENIS